MSIYSWPYTIISTKVWPHTKNEDWHSQQFHPVLGSHDRYLSWCGRGAEARRGELACCFAFWYAIQRNCLSLHCQYSSFLRMEEVPITYLLLKLSMLRDVLPVISTLLALSETTWSTNNTYKRAKQKRLAPSPTFNPPLWHRSLQWLVLDQSHKDSNMDYQRIVRNHCPEYIGSCPCYTAKWTGKRDTAQDRMSAASTPRHFCIQDMELPLLLAVSWSRTYEIWRLLRLVRWKRETEWKLTRK